SPQEGPRIYRRLRASSAANPLLTGWLWCGKHARNRPVERNRFYGEVMRGGKFREKAWKEVLTVSQGLGLSELALRAGTAFRFLGLLRREGAWECVSGDVWAKDFP